MSQNSPDSIEIDTVLNEERGGCVPEVVESNSR